MEQEQAALELEVDIKVRFDELGRLEKICATLDDSEQASLRRAMVLMLYAHFEGFVKMSFDIYVRHINEEKLFCKDVVPVLAASGMADVFRELRKPYDAKIFLPNALRKHRELHPLGVETEIVDRLAKVGEGVVDIAEEYIDLESNLKTDVLSKNLFKLGFKHDLFQEHYATISQLLGRRNAISHGADVKGVEASVYESMRAAVVDVTNSIRTAILSAIGARSYMRSA